MEIKFTAIGCFPGTSMMHRLLTMYENKPEMQKKIIAAFAASDVEAFTRNWIEQQEENRGIWKGGHHDSSDSGNRGNHSHEHLSIN